MDYKLKIENKLLEYRELVGKGKSILNKVMNWKIRVWIWINIAIYLNIPMLQIRIELKCTQLLDYRLIVYILIGNFKNEHLLL